MSDIEMIILSQAMLKLTHRTNFTVHEIHYIPRYNINGFTYETFHFGSNVDIDESTDKSFSLYNPNDSNYTFNLELDSENEGNILMSLYGLDFVDEIEATVNIQEIPFFVVEQENPLAVRPGEIGAVVTVRRVITDLDETVKFNQDIIFEYYSPKSQIDYIE